MIVCIYKQLKQYVQSLYETNEIQFSKILGGDG